MKKTLFTDTIVSKATIAQIKGRGIIGSYETRDYMPNTVSHEKGIYNIVIHQPVEYI